jgi:p-hydroxybenzoate 3-monooxygenase
MNIAIQDAVELAAGIRERYGKAKDGGRLARYSQARLPRIWHKQEFSNLMLSLFNTGTGTADQDAAGNSFSYALRRARLEQILNDPDYSHWFARAYARVDD